MRSKRISIILFIIGAFCILSAQSKAQNKIVFDKLINDLGTFSEDSNPKVCTFKFTNHQTGRYSHSACAKYMWLCCSPIY